MYYVKIAVIKSLSPIALQSSRLLRISTGNVLCFIYKEMQFSERSLSRCFSVCLYECQNKREKANQTKAVPVLYRKFPTKEDDEYMNHKHQHLLVFANYFSPAFSLPKDASEIIHSTVSLKRVFVFLDLYL